MAKNPPLIRPSIDFFFDGRGGFVGGAAASGAEASSAAPPPIGLDGRGGFVGGAVASGAGVGGAAMGLAFDRGATAPRSNDFENLGGGEGTTIA